MFDRSNVVLSGLHWTRTALIAPTLLLRASVFKNHANTLSQSPMTLSSSQKYGWMPFRLVRLKGAVPHSGTEAGPPGPLPEQTQCPICPAHARVLAPASWAPHHEIITELSLRDRGRLCQPRCVHCTCLSPSFNWDQLCNLWGPAQGDNAGPLVQKLLRV